MPYPTISFPFLADHDGHVLHLTSESRDDHGREVSACGQYRGDDVASTDLIVTDRSRNVRYSRCLACVAARHEEWENER